MSVEETMVGRQARPYLHGPETDAVAEVLSSGYYGHGPETEQFERDLAEFLQVPDVVTVASGTTALQLGLTAAGVKPGEEILVPSMTFCASVQAVLACGAVPRFMDIDPLTLCVTSDHIRQAITPSTRAVMPVLYGGRAVDLAGIQAELDAKGILVVEDAAHAFGSRNGHARVGATGVTTCFSFDPIKNLTCGEGGAIVPHSVHHANTARRIRQLGIAQSSQYRAKTTSYQVHSFGLRGHLSAINAAIGRVQLARFSRVETLRKGLWRVYQNALAEVEEVSLIDVDVDASVPFNCVVRVLNHPRDELFHMLRRQGIGVGVHYPPNHLQPAFAAWRRPLPITEVIAGQILSLPFHPAMNDGDVHTVVSALKEALSDLPSNG